MPLQKNLITDTQAHVWVNASAGTGKTKSLVDRYLSLLLEGIPTDKIICLTFTNVAAVEMCERIEMQLMEWASMPLSQLAQRLTDLLNRAIRQEDIVKARGLVKDIFFNGYSCHVQTIHAFCMDILRAFPIEAGLSPLFEVMDAEKSEKMLSRAIEETLALFNKDISLSAIVQTLAELTNFASLKALVHQFFQEKAHVKGHKIVFEEEAGEPGKALLRYSELLCRFFGLPREKTEREGLKASFLEEVDVAFLHEVATVLLSSSESLSDGKLGHALLTCLKHIHKEESKFQEFLSCFLTLTGTPRQRLCSKKFQTHYPSYAKALEDLSQRCSIYRNQANCMAIMQASQGFMQFAFAVHQKFKNLKRLYGFLDYNDIISHTRELLRQKSEWVLYKLDQKIDHILVDEAQDTNPAHWDIIKALTEEFFTGEGTTNQKRTLFVVGDYKQSIFSFQGACPQTFLSMYYEYKKRAKEANNLWHDIKFSRSYRSAEPILTLVDKTFSHKTVLDGVSEDFIPLAHEPADRAKHGLVEVWSLVKGEEIQDDRHPRQENIKRIVAFLTSCFSVRASSYYPRLQPKDVMILVRKRGPFVQELTWALKNAGIAVSGLDRFELMEDLAIKDMLALLSFLLQPLDDLNLAIVLKSPFFTITEEDLFALAYQREPLSLWERMALIQERSPGLKHAYQFLVALKEHVRFMSITETLFHILYGLEGIKLLVSCLGDDAIEALEMLITLAADYEKTSLPSLQGFVEWMRTASLELKKRGKGAENKVRILTYHASKGLESPLVILADAGLTPYSNINRSFYWAEKEGALFPLWVPFSSFSSKEAQALKEAQHIKERQEFHRMLYVAMTRACQYLIVAGWQAKSAKNEEDSTFHAYISKAIEDCGMPCEVCYEDIVMNAWRCGASLKEIPNISASQDESQEDVVVPAWFAQPIKSDFIFKKASTVVNDSFVGPGPQSEDPFALLYHQDEGELGIGREYGKALHQLLEILPSYSPPAWERVTDSLLNKFPLPPEAKKQLYDQAYNIITQEEWAFIFKGISRTEVDMSGLWEGQLFHAKVDRLVVEDQRILIVEYKTRKNVPMALQGIPPEYLRQLDIYRALVGQAFPYHRIQASILWTQGPRLDMIF